MRALLARSIAFLKGRTGVVVSAMAFFSFFTWSAISFDAERPDAWGRQVLKADAAGYYIYLPGVFRGQFKAAPDMDSIAQWSGNAFRADSLTHRRIQTKYAYGTALLNLPFFAAAEINAGPRPQDAWSLQHERAIILAGIFYWTLGLVLLGIGLARRWHACHGVILLTLACVAFGTNTFYYAFRQPGYSHNPSFMLCSLALFAMWRDHGKQLRSSSLWLFALACALLFWVRQFDAILIAGLCALLLYERPLLFRSVRFYARMTLALLVFALPQMAYWWYAFGSPFVYSYGHESFSNLFHPRIVNVLFAPDNGLITHAPVLALLPFGLFALFQGSRTMALCIGLTVCAALFGFASWWAWEFGCGYGMRPFVQYTPLTAVALLALWQWLARKAPPVLHGTVPLVLLVCFINYRVMLEFPGCYFGGTWNWHDYAETMIEAFFGGVDIAL